MRLDAFAFSSSPPRQPARAGSMKHIPEDARGSAVASPSNTATSDRRHHSRRPLGRAAGAVMASWPAGLQNTKPTPADVMPARLGEVWYLRDSFSDLGVVLRLHS
jgi:hypothetical protein